MHYFDALNALFRIENALRMFVYVVLEDSKKAKWQDLTITTDDGSSTTIAAVAKRRRNQDQRFGYLGYTVTAPLMHLTSGELIALIFHDTHWPLFSGYFPAGKEIVRIKLEEIGNIRNALAHFRPIKPDDVEVVKQNANQTLLKVERELENLILTFGRVPSNAVEEWYTELRALENRYVSLDFHQSENERWVQLRLKYASPLAEEGPHRVGDRWWRVLTVETPRILEFAPTITANVIFSGDSFYEYEIPAESKPRFVKHVDFVFSRATLTAAHGDIRSDVARVLEKISEETDLLMQDNLARGLIVRSGGVFGKQRKDKWFADRDSLRSAVSTDDPPEFWAHLLTDSCRTDVD